MKIWSQIVNYEGEISPNQYCNQSLLYENDL